MWLEGILSGVIQHDFHLSFLRTSAELLSVLVAEVPAGMSSDVLTTTGRTEHPGPPGPLSRGTWNSVTKQG